MASRKMFWRENLESVLEADAFDQWDWFRAVERVPQLHALNKRTAKEFTGQPGQDTFLSLYQDEPDLSQNPPAGTEPLSSLMKRAMVTPEWAALHEDTKGDILTAAFGAKALVDEVFRNLPDEVKEAAQEHKEAVKEQQRMEKEAEDLQATAEWMKENLGGSEDGEANDGDAGDGDASDGDAELEETLAEMEAAAEELTANAAAMDDQIENILDNFEDTADQFDARIRSAFNDAADQAGDEASDQAAYIRAFTEAAGGDPQNVSPDLAHKAMEAMAHNPYLKELAAQLGWAQRVVNAERRLSPYGGTELVGMTFGPLDLSRAAGQELVALAADEDNPLFWDVCKRVLDSAILLREYEGEEDHQGKGTMVLVRDESGSMAGVPHALAVAVEWALLDAARKDGRRFFSIPFSGTGQFQVWEAPEAGNPDPEGLLAHLAHFYNGGTEPYGPVERALELIEDNDLKADVLILTDGSFRNASFAFLSKLAAVKERVPLNIEAVVIGYYGTGGAEEWADRVHHVSDLVSDKEALREAFQGVM